MKKTFPSLTWKPLVMITNSIVTLVNPEKIFLLSVAHRLEESENIFMEASVTAAAVEAFYLLVLAAESEKRSSDELQDIIEHRSGLYPDVTVFVLPVHQFNSWLMNGHPFASRVYHRAGVLYDAGCIPLAIPNEYNELSAKEVLGKILDTHAGHAVEFISGAELFILRKQYALAAFHLHQAAEQLFSGMLWSITGLRVHTHNLDKLYRYCRHLLPQLSAIFPRNSAAEKELFRWLQKAYVDGRYNSAFGIKYMVVSQLSERVQKLLELCKSFQHSKTAHT